MQQMQGRRWGASHRFLYCRKYPHNPCPEHCSAAAWGSPTCRRATTAAGTDQYRGAAGDEFVAMESQPKSRQQCCQVAAPEASDDHIADLSNSSRVAGDGLYQALIADRARSAGSESVTQAGHGSQDQRSGTVAFNDRRLEHVQEIRDLLPRAPGGQSHFRVITVFTSKERIASMLDVK